MAGARRVGHLDVLTLGALLLPAAWLLLANKAGILGLFNDDAMYGVAARLLAEGGDPSRTDYTQWAPLSRFPIGFPAILAGLWALAGGGLGVVPLWETAVVALTLVFLLASYGLLTRAWGIDRVAAGAAVLVVAYHPMTIKYGAAVMSDLPFACLALGCLALVEWARRHPGQAAPVVLAGLAFGLTALVRYAALAPLAASALTLLSARRPKAAIGMAAVAGAVVAPWAWWVASHRLFGYAQQYLEHAPQLSFLRSLQDAAWMLVTQALPGLLAPSFFLDGLPVLGTPQMAALSLRALVGACVAAWLLWSGAVRLPDPATRVPALYALATAGLVIVWAGRFPDLAWDLEVRLLLPVAPILLAFAFAAALREVRRLGALRRGALGLAVLALAGYIAADDADLNRRQIGRTSYLADYHLGGLLAAKAYIGRLPADVRVGAIYPFQVYFYMERPIASVECSVPGLLAARDKGIRVILAMPNWRNDQDQMFETVQRLTRETPPKALVLYAATNFMAVVHLPADPAHPPESR